MPGLRPAQTTYHFLGAFLAIFAWVSLAYSESGTWNAKPGGAVDAALPEHIPLELLRPPSGTKVRHVGGTNRACWPPWWSAYNGAEFNFVWLVKNRIKTLASASKGSRTP